MSSLSSVYMTFHLQRIFPSFTDVLNFVTKSSLPSLSFSTILIFALAPSAMSVTSAQRQTSSPTRAFIIALPSAFSQRGFEIFGFFSSTLLSSVSACVSVWFPLPEEAMLASDSALRLSIRSLSLALMFLLLLPNPQCPEV